MPGFSKFRFLAACCVAALAGIAPKSASARERPILVGIIPKADSFVFVPEGTYRVSDALGHEHDLIAGKTYVARASDRLLSLGTWTLPARVWIVSKKESSVLRVAGRIYPGDFFIRLNGDRTVTAIEKLGIEKYLLGVVGHEMDPSWPIEALKAQAVVARTFAYVQLEKSHSLGYDVGDDSNSQVYGGVAQTPRNVGRAVEETRGEVLGYRGKLLSLYYHSCCGGHTADAGWVWGLKGKTPRPLRGVADPYCKISPYYRWKVFFTNEEIVAALESRRLFGGSLEFFSLGDKKDDYVKNFKARIGDRPLRVNANQFRLAIGPSSLKSVRLFDIKKERNGIEFKGGGSGHGVGLCQWGARAQAGLGRSYEKILKFYFPGAILSVVE